MKPEFSIEQIRDFVNKEYTSVSARFAKSMLQHYDEVNNIEIKRDRNSSQQHFNSEIEAIEWVRSHTPFLIRARKKGCDKLVRSFTGNYAFDMVTKNIGQHLFKISQDNV